MAQVGFQEITQYRVEKFIPTQCPRCQNQFNRNDDQGFLLATYWQHESREASQEIVESIACDDVATDLIVCGRCHNVTLRVKIEEWYYATLAEAEAMASEGFRNAQECKRTFRPGTPPPRCIVFLGGGKSTLIE